MFKLNLSKNSSALIIFSFAFSKAINFSSLALALASIIFAYISIVFYFSIFFFFSNLVKLFNNYLDTMEVVNPIYSPDISGSIFTRSQPY